ncbi:MAG: hypothetical protein E7119_03010 [Bacteroidales bacterium]|nr:hypothetical protein [Bacteroidales bacterium]
MKGKLPLLFLIIFQFLSVTLLSQQKREERDSLVRLVEAGSAQILEVEGVSFRKVTGNARFFHNNTYLLCDTALWNVNENVIKALGNVQVIQDNTFLVSDKIDYVVDENLAKVRGNLVELYDKDGNVLRTNFLDYNTRDSIGNFFNGGVMKGSNGNIIESLEGWYFAYDKLFSFEENVQMFTDSVFIKADQLEYSTAENKAYFGKNTTAWQEDNILFSNDGEFDRGNNLFRFYKDGYILTKDQELWADTLSYYRNTGEAELSGNIQILDTKQSAYAFADHATYRPDPLCITLTRNPAVALYSVENGVRDTMFLTADTLKYYQIRYCDVDSAAIEHARARVELSELDPLVEIEAESAKKRIDNTPISDFITPKRANKEEPQQATPDSLDTVSGQPLAETDSLNASQNLLISNADSLSAGSDQLRSGADSLLKAQNQMLPVADSLLQAQNQMLPVADSLLQAQNQMLPVADSLAALQDQSGIVPDSEAAALVKDSTLVSGSLLAVNDSLVSLRDSLPALSDSLSVRTDSVAVQPLDTTAVTFIDAWNNVKVYRNDIQALCDSLVYSDLDSMARLYINPVMWNEVKHQFTSDSMQLVIKGGVLSKANLLSNAFIASQEDTLHYNQIKGTEMVAYFKDNDLYRYDALGGASMIFYLQEDGIITMMNQKEGKIISARIKNREIQRIKYIESLKNDAYPVYNLPVEKQRLKGFNWRGDERPKERFELVDRSIKQTQRKAYKRKRFPNYPYTAVYFPQERDGIMDFKRKSDEARAAREKARIEAEKVEQTDSVAQVMEIPEDTLAAVMPDDNLPEKVDINVVETEEAADDKLLKPHDNLTETEVSESELSRKQARIQKRLYKKEQKRLKREERKAKRQERKLAKEARKLEKVRKRMERKAKEIGEAVV